MKTKNVLLLILINLYSVIIAENSIEIKSQFHNENSFDNISKEAVSINNNNELFYAHLINEKEHVIQLTWNEMPIKEAIEIFADNLNFDFVLNLKEEDKDRNKITLSLDKKISNKNLWGIFASIMLKTGFNCSLENNIIYINENEGKTKVLGGNNTNIKIEFYQLKNALSKNVVKKIEPLLSDEASVIDSEQGNSVIVIDSLSNILKINRLIEFLDNSKSLAQEIIPVANIPVSKIVSELLNIMPILGYPVTADNAICEVGSIHLAGIDRMQIILASAANSEAITELKRWVMVLDKENIGSKKLFIYNVQNGDAQQFSDVLSGIFNANINSVSTSQKVTNSKTRNYSKTRKTSSKSKKSLERSDVNDLFDEPVDIVTDSINNRLIIKTSTKCYALIKALLEKLDSPPIQVALKIMVSSVALDDGMSAGINWGRNDISNEHAQLSTGTLISDSTFGLSTTITNVIDPTKFIELNALATNGKVKVLSCPEIVVKNNETAKLSDGKKIPIVTSDSVDTSGGASSITNRNIEYQDTGIILEITPKITASGLIELEIKQEVSSVDSSVATGIDSPTIRKSEIHTILTIKDGETFLLGGVISETDVENINKIPLLGDIPLLGRLFTSVTTTKNRSELVMLVSGYIIKNHSKLDQSIAKYKQAIKLIDSIVVDVKNTNKE